MLHPPVMESTPGEPLMGPKLGRGGRPTTARTRKHRPAALPKVEKRPNTCKIRNASKAATLGCLGAGSDIVKLRERAGVRDQPAASCARI